MQDKQQIYGRNDMVMLDKHNKIYGSLGLTEQFVFDTINGENTVVLNNPKVGKFKDVVTDLNILGNSHQDSTTGKQLFKLTDNYLHAYFYHGDNQKIVPFTNNAVVYLPCEPNTTYTIHGRKNINNDMTRKNRVGLTSELPAFNVNITKTAETTLDEPVTITTEEDTKYLVIMTITDGEIGALDFDKVLENNTSKLMVEVGDKASPYEPYTGGKPSPSPDYPQQIKNVGKWNEETQKYEVDVKVTGKNLFDKELAVNAPIISYRYIPIRVGKGAKVSVSYSKQLTTGLGFYVLISKDLGSSSNSYVWLYHSSASSLIKNKYTFTAVDDVISLSFAGDINSTFENMFNDLQIEISDTPTDYEPYREPQSITITSDRPITKWDRLVEQGGEIGWLYAGVVIDRFNGQSNKISIANKQGDVQNFSIQFENVANGNGNSDIFVDKYRAVQLSYTKAEYGICCNWNDGVKYFSAPNENVATVDEFNAWLIENPLKIAYETTNPEFVPLPQSEQDAIRALTTYHPTTVIMVDGGELPVGIQATYKQVNK